MVRSHTAQHQISTSTLFLVHSGGQNGTSLPSRNPPKDMKGTEYAHIPHCRPLSCTPGLWPVTNQHPPNADARLGILFIGVSQVLVGVPWPRGQGCGGGMAVPEAAGERVSSGINKILGRLLCSGVDGAGGLGCSSQPKTLLAGPALGFSKTVSVPVRERLNTDGAATPACSAGRTGQGVLRGPAQLPQDGRALFSGATPGPRSSGLLERTHRTPILPTTADTHLHPPP